jgi:hypothetical protein
LLKRSKKNAVLIPEVLKLHSLRGMICHFEQRLMEFIQFYSGTFYGCYNETLGRNKNIPKFGAEALEEFLDINSAIYK